MGDNRYNKYQSCLVDYCHEIKEEALEAKKRFLDEPDPFHDGYALAYHRVVDLMCQFAENFDIDLKELSLHDINPYKDLL